MAFLCLPLVRPKSAEGSVLLLHRSLGDEDISRCVWYRGLALPSSHCPCHSLAIPPLLLTLFVTLGSLHLPLEVTPVVGGFDGISGGLG